MSQTFDSKWIRVTNDVTLHENDLDRRLEIIKGKEYVVIYRVLGSEYNLIEGMIPIQEMVARW